MFAVRNGGGLALEGREPGGFLGQVYVGDCEGTQTTKIIDLAGALVGSNLLLLIKGVEIGPAAS